MPVCSRCTGIYLGFFISLLIIVLIDRKIKGEFPPLKIVFTGLAVFMIMGIDVGLTALGITDSSNIIRFATGFSTGWFIALMLLPLKNIVMFRVTAPQHYLNSKKKFLAWLGIGAVMAAIFIFSYRYVLMAWGVLTVSGMIMLAAYAAVILLFALIKKWMGSINSRIKYLFSMAGGIIISMGLLALFSYARRFLI